jgi:hypothetical protein
MKFAAERPFANLDAAVKKLLEIANAMEADHVGRLHIGTINREFLNAGGSVAEYGAAVKAAIDLGYVALHPSGAYLTFTQAGRSCSRKPPSHHANAHFNAVPPCLVSKAPDQERRPRRTTGSRER